MKTDTRVWMRHTLIDIARRHQRAGAGSLPAFLAQRTVEMAWTDLTPILAPIHWAVVGAAATRLYMPERITRDLDVAIQAEDAHAARKKLADARFVHQGDLSIGGSTWQSPDGQWIDVIEAREAWWRDALTAAQSNRDAQGLPILPLPYLVLMKFQSGRAQDVADVTRMLGLAEPAALTATRALFKQYAPTDLDDLESLIALGRLETGDDAKQ